MWLPDIIYFQGQAMVGLQHADEARTVLARALAVLRETAGRRGFVDTAILIFASIIRKKLACLSVPCACLVRYMDRQSFGIVLILFYPVISCLKWL
ncbi:MAG: hypothetical protein R3293_25175 [Candidatus Promineifilaceae bacterium]|nr:hypothetical protein [Candidatus Promineifilaceae bacterium]